MAIIEVNHVSMRFNLSKEKHESLKEYFLAMAKGKLQFDEFCAMFRSRWSPAIFMGLWA